MSLVQKQRISGSIEIAGVFFGGGGGDIDIIPVYQIIPAVPIWRERRIVPAAIPNFVGGLFLPGTLFF